MIFCLVGFTGNMIACVSALVLAAAALTSALPTNDPTLLNGLQSRGVTSLNQGAFEEAQQRDATATRAFSSIEIKACSSLLKQGALLTTVDFNWRLFVH
jgi:hypothetical protein